MESNLNHIFELQYALDTFYFLICGALVMWMAAGFAMLEAGLVRSKNVSVQCLKNIGLYSIAGLMFWVIGYSIAYPGFEGGFIGVADFPYAMQGVGEADTGTGYSVASDWFFQMVFCATTASIVSGTVAERIKIVPFFIFVTLLTGFIYPIAGSWKWGGGFLDGLGFYDFAGSTLVHSVGGWGALVGAMILGPRLGKYDNVGVTTGPTDKSSVNARILEAFEAEGADAWFAEGAKERFLGNDHDHEKWLQVMDILDVWFDSGSTHSFVLEARDDLAPIRTSRNQHLRVVDRPPYVAE